MKFLLCILLITTQINLSTCHFRRRVHTSGNNVLYAPADKSEALPPDEWFTQKLDHFNAAVTATWEQRFFTNSTFYKPGGPIFLMIGGEGTADPIWMVTGQWVTYAKKFNAFCLLLEHRYYGKSHPSNDMSVKNIQFLSSEQALADLANFRVSMAEKLNFSRNKWIVFGGSYPGSLASWFRLKYPHLSDGAVAASAPILAQMNFKNYLAVVQESLGSECSQAFSKATQTIEVLLQHQIGARTVQSVFNTCDPIDIMDQMEVYNFYSVLAGNVENVVQYNKDNRAFEGALGTDITVDRICKIMTNASKLDDVDRFAVVNKLILKGNKQSCLDASYGRMIKGLKEESWNSSDANSRMWVYQTCTEFGFFQTSDLQGQPFGPNFPLKFFQQQCIDIFGPKFSTQFLADGIRSTNIQYGGYAMKVSKVIFYNGSIDPWHALGVIKDLSPDATAAFVNGTAHCANMYPDSADDPPELVSVRHREVNLIAKWIA